MALTTHVAFCSIKKQISRFFWKARKHWLVANVSGKSVQQQDGQDLGRLTQCRCTQWTDWYMQNVQLTPEIMQADRP